MSSVKKTPVLQTGKSWLCSSSILALQPEAVVEVFSSDKSPNVPYEKMEPVGSHLVLHPSHTHREQLMPAQQAAERQWNPPAFT